MPNLGEHGSKGTRDTLCSSRVYERFIFAFDVLWVGRRVGNPARDAVCELRDTSPDKTVNIERNSSNCDRFVTAYNIYQVRLQ